MNMTRRDIDAVLEELDAEIAGAPEDDELEAYFLGSQIFYDLPLSDVDIPYVAQRLHSIALKYELQIGLPAA
ncbi:MAG TPA: hypothetical protein VM619_05905 [Luteimonas sp.]|nr:hypothetical protein [Luteimonas sp.]